MKHLFLQIFCFIFYVQVIHYVFNEHKRDGRQYQFWYLYTQIKHLFLHFFSFLCSGTCNSFCFLRKISVTVGNINFNIYSMFKHSEGPSAVLIKILYYVLCIYVQ